MIISDALVANPVHQGEPLGSIDRLCSQVNELLRVALNLKEVGSFSKNNCYF